MSDGLVVTTVQGAGHVRSWVGSVEQKKTPSNIETAKFQEKLEEEMMRTQPVGEIIHPIVRMYCGDNYPHPREQEREIAYANQMKPEEVSGETVCTSA